MSVLNPRNRLVNFRLSEVEFDMLKAACSRQGARSISDFARTSVLRCLEEPIEAASALPGRLSDLNQKVADLETRMEQLLRLVGATGASSLARAASVPLSAEGGDLKHN